jgi:hypothetical protein
MTAAAGLVTPLEQECFKCAQLTLTPLLFKKNQAIDGDNNGDGYFFF